MQNRFYAEKLFGTKEERGEGEKEEDGDGEGVGDGEKEKGALSFSYSLHSRVEDDGREVDL